MHECEIATVPCASGVVHGCRTGRVSSGCCTKRNGTCNGAYDCGSAKFMHWHKPVYLSTSSTACCADATVFLSVIMKGISTGGPVDTATVQKRQEFAARMGQKTDFGEAPRGYVAGMGNSRQFACTLVFSQTCPISTCSHGMH